MGFGYNADVVAGRLSRVLHGLRGPKENTISELGPYLDRPLVELCPEPPPVAKMNVHESLASRLLHTTTLTWESAHCALSPTYQRRHEGEYRANRTAYARWIRRRGAPRKECLVYVHGWLEPGSWVEEAFLFPSWLRELDVDVLHVSLPFHGRRNPRGALFSGEYYFTADLVRSFEGILQAVCDARSAIAWLRKQGYTRVGATGVSLGGSIVMLLSCLEPVPDYTIPIVAHIRLGEAIENAAILWRIKEDLERFGVSADERRRIFARLGLETVRPVLPPAKQLWIEAAEDAHIDPNLVRAQWEDWGRPKIHWIPGGHMTFPLHRAEITSAMKGFLTTTFGNGRARGG